MQAAGYFVTLGIEFSAGVQLRHHHLRRRNALVLMHVNRNPAAVVDDSDGVVQMDGHIDLGGIPRQRLIHRVVYHFVDQVVQA